MKKIVLLLTVLIAMVACEDKVKDIGKGKIDPMATIKIRPAKGIVVRSNGMTALQVVQDAHMIQYQSNYFDNKYYEEAKDITRGFNEHQKDFNIPALLMLGIDVISAQGTYYRDLTYAFDFYILNEANDTIAYVPDEVINSARPLIEAAFADGNYNEVYRLFDEAFVFHLME